ncbi:MAG: STAS domain-containing protein [Thermoleophilaceae bacterium]
MALTISFAMRDAARRRELVLRLDGELDGDSALTLDRRLHSLPEADVVIVDLRGLSFIDSTGLRVLVQAKHSQGESLRLVGAPPPVAHVFETSGAGELLEQP